MRKRLARKNAKSRAQRAQERDKVRSLLEGETVESDDEDSEEQGEGHKHDEQESEVETPLRNINGRERKRRKDVSFEPWEGTRKKARYEGTDSVSFHRTSFFGASEFSVKRIGSLGYQRPNPMNLARSNWLSKIYHKDDATSDSEDESLSGPEADVARPLISNTDSGDAKNWRKSFSRGPNAIDEEDLAVSSVGALTFKPTPGNYAKRRWSSEVWTSNIARDSSPKGSNQSDGERTSPEYSDDEGSIDVNVDYKKRYSIYFITQRDDAGSDNSSSNEEVCFNPVPYHFRTDI